MTNAKTVPQDDWTTVADEAPTRLVFDTDGDTFQGIYLGTEEVAPENGMDPWNELRFRDDEGVLYAISESYKLKAAFTKIKPGQYVRITRTKEIQTRNGLNPMKDYVVQVRG